MTGSLPSMGIDSPCMNCLRRSVGCHADCAEYARYGAELAARRERRDAVRRRDGMMLCGVKRSLNERDKARFLRRMRGKR